MNQSLVQESFPNYSVPRIMKLVWTLEWCLRYFLILVFESFQSTMGIFLIYDIEVQIVYLTSGKTKSNCLNGGPLGSVSFISWEFPSFHWEFQWLTDWLRKSYLLICVVSHIHRSHGEAVIVAASVVCCVCVCVIYIHVDGVSHA